jgi:hypothetical protein
MIYACLLIAGAMLPGIVPAAADIVSNVLSNPGFESGNGTTNADWVSSGNVYRMSSHARSGSWSTKMYGNWGIPGQANGSSVSRVFSAQPGQTWEGRGWVSTWSEDPIAGSNRAQLAIVFLDEASNALWSVYSPRWLDTNTPWNTWQQLDIRSSAPVDTEYVRFSAYFLQPWPFTNGSAWFDDCAFGLSTVTNRLTFAGRSWTVQEGYMTPQFNLWSTNCAWVDTYGRLHLAIRSFESNWYCAMVNNNESLGYGTYRWETATYIDRLEAGTMLGLFTYEATRSDTWNEIDFEFSRVGGMAVSNLQFAIQPWYHTGNLLRTPMTQSVAEMTHEFLWTPGDIHFQSWEGHTPAPVDSNAVFATWVYTGADVPVHSNEMVYMNWYLLLTNAPAGTQHLEVVITDFQFTPFDGVRWIDRFNDHTRSNFWALTGVYPEHGIDPLIIETNDDLCVAPDGDWETAGYISTNPVGWNNRDATFVFAGVLSSVRVDTARSGYDVRATLALSSARVNGWIATNSLVLHARYDDAADTINFLLQTKTNQPNADGETRFDGALSAASAYLGDAGGICMQLELGRGAYRLGLTDRAGTELPVTTNSGALSGAHDLGATLGESYWLVGAMNEDSGRGRVWWDRSEIGVDLPLSAPAWSRPVPMGGSQEMLLSWSSCYSRVYTLFESTNLVSGHWREGAVFRATPPLNVVTTAIGQTPACYRLLAR